MTAKEWFQKARKENFAIGAFNVDSLEIFRGICIAGKNKKSPVMLEFSQGEVGYFGLANIVDMVLHARREYQIPILLNLDHSKKVEDCLAAINIGRFDDVHFDGSELPYDENVIGAKKVVAAAHAKGLLVEGEIDKISGSSEAHLEDIDVDALKKSYSDPARAKKFVSETGVDIFAAFFGNLHGTFTNEPQLDIKLLGEIAKTLPDTFLSMHGGSGISAGQVREAIDVGKIVKVNVNTELRVAFHDALGEQVSANPDELAYYKLTDQMVMAVAAVVEGKIGIFGSAGKAS